MIVLCNFKCTTDFKERKRGLCKGFRLLVTAVLTWNDVPTLCCARAWRSHIILIFRVVGIAFSQVLRLTPLRTEKEFSQHKATALCEDEVPGETSRLSFREEQDDLTHRTVRQRGQLVGHGVPSSNSLYSTYTRHEAQSNYANEEDSLRKSLGIGNI